MSRRSRLNIWLIMSGEPLEMFGERPHRIGMLSKVLAQRGHNVTWFTTTFDHQKKEYLYKKTTFVRTYENVDMVFLHSKTPYFRNVSLKRIKNHQEVAREFESTSKKLSRPDVILTAFPTIDLAYVAVRYGLLNKVPVIVDVRDMWPETFLDILPKILRPLGRLILLPYYRKSEYIFRNATAITAMTDEFLFYGLKFAKRERRETDKSFPFGYNLEKVDDFQKKESLKRLMSLGFNPSMFNVCFFGNIGRQFDFDTLIKAADRIRNVQFVISGNGDLLDYLRNQALHLENVVLTGWITKPDILTLMEYCDLAIAPYVNKYDFLSSLPNKIIEYMAGGLPILSSINGVIGKLITEHKIGRIYYNDVDLLVKHIRELQNNESLRYRMSLNAKKLFNRNFRADIVYNNMADYIEEIADNYCSRKR